MDEDIKVTYSIIGVLIVVLGGIAYFLQGNVDLPQVQTSTSSLKTSPVKKVNDIPTKPLVNNQSTTSTTTMQLPEKITSATITTNKGVIEITFATNSPETVKNFATLAVNNFYNGTRFHRVIRDFMIQGGDPLSKDVANKRIWGTGGPGYSFKDEFHADDALPQGTLAMANSGPNTNGSQFFIVTSITGTPYLAGKHTVFGHVTKGLDVAIKINEVPTTEQSDGNKPLEDIIVEKVEIK